MGLWTLRELRLTRVRSDAVPVGAAASPLSPV
jgi:hypothetical protein